MADSTFDWTRLIAPAANALGTYWAGRQYGNAVEQAGQQADPWAQYRPAAAAQLNALTQNPSSITSHPGYQFGLDQGVNAISRSAAAKGLLGSGNVGYELQKFGQDYGTNFLDKERNYLATVSGAKVDPHIAAAMALQGRGTQLGAYGQALGSLTGQQPTGANNSLLSTGVNAIASYFGGNNTGGGYGYQMPETGSGAPVYGSDIGGDQAIDWSQYGAPAQESVSYNPNEQNDWDWSYNPYNGY
jgi:hypothetical protein